MSDKEALDILIANAVCISPKLHCDDDCPFYQGEDEECKYDLTNELLEKAVKHLNKEIQSIKEK